LSRGSLALEPTCRLHQTSRAERYSAPWSAYRRTQRQSLVLSQSDQIQCHRGSSRHWDDHRRRYWDHQQFCLVPGFVENMVKNLVLVVDI
jgi:hypothetical protein